MKTAKAHDWAHAGLGLMMIQPVEHFGVGGELGGLSPRGQVRDTHAHQESQDENV